MFLTVNYGSESIRARIIQFLKIFFHRLSLQFYFIFQAVHILIRRSISQIQQVNALTKNVIKVLFRTVNTVFRLIVLFRTVNTVFRLIVLFRTVNTVLGYITSGMMIVTTRAGHATTFSCCANIATMRQLNTQYNQKRLPLGVNMEVCRNIQRLYCRTRDNLLAFKTVSDCRLCPALVLSLVFIKSRIVC